VSVRSSIFRFLHLRRKGTIAARMITTTPTAIKRYRDPPLRVAVGVVAAAAGGTVCEDGLAVAAGVAGSVAEGMTVSGAGLIVAAGTVAAAACVAESLREWAESRAG